MAFERPTLAQLIERTNADLASRMKGRAAVLRRSVLGVLSRVLAGISHQLHGHLDYNARQILPDTADDEHLARWASIWKVPRTGATFAAGGVTVAGLSGSVVPQGAVWQRDDGVEYVTDADATLVDGQASVSLTAIEAGAEGNVEAGITLSLLSPIAGVDSTAPVVAGGIAGGADQEPLERWRDRLMQRIQNPPQGGTLADYEQWALEVPEVTRAWPYRHWMGAGTVGVAIVCDDLAPIIPDAAKVQEAKEHIDDKRPVTAEVFLFAPTAAPVDFVFSSLTPNKQAVRDAVAAELADMIKREARPGGMIKISHIREAISIAAGEEDYVLDSPSADIVHGAGVMPTMGAITWP